MSGMTGGRQRVAVVGLGNLLLRDDGVGVHALRILEAAPPPEIEFFDVGTAALHALECVAGAGRVLALDAVRAGGAPGTVYALDGYDAAECGRLASLHSMGLRSAFHLLPPGERPAVFRIIGVEPAVIDYGLDLSPAVAAALPHAVAAARALLAEWAAPA